MKLQEQIETYNKKDIVLLDQGTNGCIFHPDIKCSKPTKKNAKDKTEYISKIQLKSEAENEEKIGKQLATLPHFKNYFAPILESCPVNLSTIDERQIEKCDVIKKNSSSKTTSLPPNFVSSKIQYLGKTTLGDYLLAQFQTSKDYFAQILETHIYLLESLIKLQGLDIVHFDLKGNNIMYNEKLNLPILIDFGMSIQNITSLDTSEYATVFPTIAEEYFPWCIDIVLLCYIAKTLKTQNPLEKAYQEKISDKHLVEMKRHVSIYILKNPILQIACISKPERDELETVLHTWIDSQKSKSWTQFAKELISYHKSWDNYSISAIYLLELDDTMSITNPTIKEYIDILKSNILQDPKTRWSPGEIKSQLIARFKNIKKSTLKKIIQDQETKINTPNYIESIKKKRKQRSFKEKEDTTIIQKNLKNLKNLKNIK
jgi:serine/threonine protein kinase